MTRKSSGLRRPKYFDRQKLTAADLNAGQSYLRERLRRHNRFLHGWGVVCGAQVSAVPGSPWALQVARGFLLTPRGDEIFLPQGLASCDVEALIRQCLPDLSPCAEPGTPEPVEDVCVDFTTFEPDTAVPNPRTERGIRFTAINFDGTVANQSRIDRFGNFTGLDLDNRTDIDLEAPVDAVDLTLTHFSSPPRVEAFDASGAVVGRAAATTDQGRAETLRVRGNAITRVVVVAPQNEALLLDFCAVDRPLECTDFSAMEEEEPGPNPRRLEDGVVVTAFDFQGAQAENTRIGQMGDFNGLNCNFNLEILLPSPSSAVDLSVVHFSSPVQAAGFDANGAQIVSAVMSAPQNLPETLRLRGAGIRLVTVTAPQNEAVLLDFCWTPVEMETVYFAVCPTEEEACPRPAVPADCQPAGETYDWTRVEEGYSFTIACDLPASHAPAPLPCTDVEAIVCGEAHAPCPSDPSETDNCVILATLAVTRCGIAAVDDLRDRRQLLSETLQLQYLRCQCRDQPTPLPPQPPGDPPFVPPIAPPVPPVGPIAPIAPIGPIGPIGPIAPIAPIGPIAPIAPIAPVTPIGPVTPIAPIAPIAPIGPIGPIAPIAPIGPIAPITPIGPVIPIGPLVPFDATAPIGPIRSGSIFLDSMNFDLERGLEQPVTEVGGIGPVRARRLAEVGVDSLVAFATRSAGDLAEHLRISVERAEEMLAEAREKMRRS